jgi:hypothetical protein
VKMLLGLCAQPHQCMPATEVITTHMLRGDDGGEHQVRIMMGGVHLILRLLPQRGIVRLQLLLRPLGPRAELRIRLLPQTEREGVCESGIVRRGAAPSPSCR